MTNSVFAHSISPVQREMFAETEIMARINSATTNEMINILSIVQVETMKNTSPYLLVSTAHLSPLGNHRVGDKYSIYTIPQGLMY